MSLRLYHLYTHLLQKVVLGKESTRLLTKTELTTIYDYVNRYTSEQFGISIEFPNKSELEKKGLKMKNLGFGLIALSVAVGIFISVIIMGAFYMYQPLRVYMAETYTKTIVLERESLGKAKLLQAENERKIIIEQAKAEKESATLRAEAIEIIGKKAKEYPEYRTQEFIGAFAEALKEGKISQIMYVPTEANIPITEAGKR